MIIQLRRSRSKKLEVVLKLSEGYDAVINPVARIPGEYKVATHNT
jgi:hypothetical protein